MLTQKQEKFVRELVAGKSQREAYKAAYNTSRYKDSSIDVEACKLFNTPKILQRYKELLDKANEKAVLSALDKRKMLKEIAESEDNSVIERLKALDIDNKMAGEYITKVQGDISVKKLEDLL